MAIDYSQSEQDRELLIRQRQRNTARAFEEMRKKIDEQIATMNMSTVSEKVKRQQLEEIRDQLQKSLGAYYSDLEDGLKSDMISIGESVLSDSAAFYNSLNMPLSIGITSFPVEIMENVINGSVYGEKWFLSGALWGDYQSKLDDINTVIAEGIGINKPIYEIAKDLEKYVDPNVRKDWAWSKVYPGTARTVDYNAQRLARTLISHAYQQNVVRQAQANPFASGVKWEASGGERMCEICEERDGKIFPVDDVPLDHPNGMCTFAVETPSMKEMSDTLADWVNGEHTDWDDQLNAYYEGRPIEHKDIIKKEDKFDINKFRKDAELYVSGGYGVDQAFSSKDIEYMQDHLEKYDGKMYRVEESVFTADKLDDDMLDMDGFRFSGSFRSFSRDFDVVKSMLDENSDDYGFFEAPVIFEILPGAYQFNMSDYTSAYSISDQKESLVGGEFEFVKEDYKKINGNFIRIITIKQSSKK